MIKQIKFEYMRVLKPNRYSLVIVLGLLLLQVSTMTGYAQRTVTFPHEDTIVLDPGHGGHDQGAQGPKGSLEKTVTLNLARRIQAVIGDNYKVILTRTDDYGLELAERTAAANHIGANLFIGLHTGGSLRHETTGMTVYYYEETYRPMKVSELVETEAQEKGDQLVAWDTVQLRHVAESRRFAEILQDRLKRESGTSSCELQGAPLAVLKGADMPAVLIETGYLTHPVDENKLNDPDMLNEIAAMIGQAIDDFLVKTP
ncbi:N-acetylmuramoyl-L-alanine amidase [Thermodesulfobacteriota bacterium]